MAEKDGIDELLEEFSNEEENESGTEEIDLDVFDESEPEQKQEATNVKNESKSEVKPEQEVSDVEKTNAEEPSKEEPVVEEKPESENKETESNEIAVETSDGSNTVIVTDEKPEDNLFIEDGVVSDIIRDNETINTEEAPEDNQPHEKEIDGFERINILISSIVEISDTNTRGECRDDETFPGFCESIGSEGILQPLIVERLTEDTYKLHAGKRRLNAARERDIQFMPVTVVDPKKHDVKIVSAIENLVRQDLNPVEEAKAYKVLMDNYGLSQAKLAKRVGKTQGTISNKMLLLQASAKMLNALIHGVITESDVLQELRSKGNKERKASYTIKIPESDLPDATKIAIKLGIVSVSIKFGVDETEDVGMQIRRAIAKVAKDLDAEKIQDGYKSVAAEQEE